MYMNFMKSLKVSLQNSAMTNTYSSNNQNNNNIIEITQNCRKYGEIFLTPKLKRLYKCLMCSEIDPRENCNSFVTSDIDVFWKHIENLHCREVIRFGVRTISMENDLEDHLVPKAQNVIVIDDDDDDFDDKAHYSGTKADTRNKQNDNIYVPEKLNKKTAPINVHHHDVFLPETEISQETQLPQKRKNECQGKTEEEWIRVTNEQLFYDLNIEMEKNTEDGNEVTMETPVANQNESNITNTLSEEKVDLNIKEETNIKSPDEYSPIKNLTSVFDVNKIEKYLAYYDNDTILLSDDDDEDEVDDDGDVSTSTTERGATVSPPNNTNEEQPIKITKFKCLLCPRKHVTNSEKSMFKHMLKFHGLDNINHCQKIICDQKKISCKYCDFKYVRGYIYQHMRKQHPTEYKARPRAASKIHAATGTPLSPTNCRPFINYLPPYAMPPAPEFLEKMKITKEEHEAICHHLYMKSLQSNAASAETSRLRSPEYNFYENGTEVESYGTLDIQETKMEL